MNRCVRSSLENKDAWVSVENRETVTVPFPERKVRARRRFSLTQYSSHDPPQPVATRCNGKAIYRFRF